MRASTGESVRSVRLPSRIGGEVEPIPGVPRRFPRSLETFPDIRFPIPHARFLVAYRPYESAFDGTGWASEEIALLDEEQRWSRLQLSDLDLDDASWPGADPTGTGWLNPKGTRLALRTAAGIAVVDLRTGSVRRYAARVGQVGGLRWSPDGRRITLHPVHRARDVVVDSVTGRLRVADVPLSGLGFLPNGHACSISSSNDGDVVLTTRSEGASDPSRIKLGNIGRHPADTFMSWSQGSRVAYRSWNTEGGRFVMRVADLRSGEQIAVVTIGRRVGTRFQVHGWTGRGGVLLQISKALFTWNPATSDLTRVAILPSSDRHRAHGAVGLDISAAPLQ